ncbi:MAG TPA: hypothetical protein VEW48_20650, partial [Thermoanaerobaculia bacterium]|nr:hypothetical protein [Thermoanaerobaculia bacterium]
MRILSRPFPCGLAAFLLTTLLATSAEAGQDRWTPIGVGAGVMQSLAVDPTVTGVVYATAGISGIYRSDDGAQSWQWRGAVTVNLDTWTSVVVSPADPERLYATTRPTQVSSGAVYTSNDGGLSWLELIRTRVGFSSVAVSADGVVLAASPLSEIFRSSDGGATWSQVLVAGFPSSGEPIVLGFDPLAPANAYAGGREGIWRSTDHGVTWTKIGTLPDGQPALGVSALAFPGNAPGFLYALMRSRLYRSEDGGLTWSGGVLLTGGYAALAVDPTDPRTVYTSGTSIYVSHDGGDTATLLPAPPDSTLSGFPAIAISPAAPETIYLSVYLHGVAVSTDGGEHWSLSQQRGLSANQTFPGLSFYAAPSGRLYQNPRLDGVLYLSLDRDASWSPLAPVPNSFVDDLTEEVGTRSHLWAAAGFLFHSTDSGASWTRIPAPVSATQVVSPARGIVLAGSCGVRRSLDDGRTWEQIVPCTIGTRNNQTTFQIERLEVPHGWPGAAWAEVATTSPTGGSGFLVLFTQNSGRTWRTLARGISSFQGNHVVAASRGVIYLDRGAAIQRSADGGATWESRSAGGAVLSIAVDAVDPNIVYAATRNRGVLRSTNGGRTWSRTDAGLARLGRLWVRDVMTDPLVSGVAYSFPVKGGVFQARFGE